MSDSIDRQAAIDFYVKRMPSVQPDIDLSGYSDRLWQAAYERGKAEAKVEWIPVTERLPDLWDERYLVSLAWGGVGVMEYKSTGFHNYGSFSPVPIETVTAWMPLPEPYREEGGSDA